MALPGVQVLFAFLLVVPFNTRFSELSAGQERAYLISLMGAGLASALLIAPPAQHRMTFRQQEKEWIVVSGNRLTVAGLGFLAISMTAAIWLVVDVVFARATAIVCAAIVGSMFVALWYALPLHRRGAKRGDASRSRG